MIRIAEQFGLTNLVYQKYTGNAYLYREMSKKEGYTVALNTLKDHILSRYGIEVSMEVERGARVLSITVILTQ
jgi:hypothetical protein